MLPFASAAGPAPACHTDPSLPLGVKFRTLTRLRLVSLYPMTHAVYGKWSQCDAQLVYTVPFQTSKPARSLYCFGSKVSRPPTLPSPVPAYVACTSTGPLNSSPPVVKSSACNLWWYIDPFFDIATTYIVPCGPICGSITGVDVIPISGDTCPQLRSSEGATPANSIETCQNCVPVSASKA